MAAGRGISSQQMYADERYTLQIDSHTRFRLGWDRLVIDMLKGLPSAKPLITSFPPLYFREDGRDRYTRLDELHKINTTVAEYWSPEGWIHHPNRYIAENSRVPRRTRFLSGGFVFTSGEWNRVVTQDPLHYYTGEEFALTLRSFAHGYDLFDSHRDCRLAPLPPANPTASTSPTSRTRWPTTSTVRPRDGCARCSGTIRRVCSETMASVACAPCRTTISIRG